MELAVALVAFTSILILALHFGQVSLWSLKVVEAGNFGLWDATAGQQHDLTVPNWNLWQTAITTASSDAQTAYTNFDVGGAKVFSNHNTITAQCAQNPAGDAMAPTASRYMPGIYPAGNSGVSCSANLLVWDVRIPTGYLNGAGNAWRPIPMFLCAAGPASGASCPGQFSLLLDDWGLSGAAESQPCAVTGCLNTAYRIHRGPLVRSPGQTPAPK